MESEVISEKQQENRDRLPHYLSLAAENGFSPTTIDFFTTELNRKVPFHSLMEDIPDNIKARNDIVKLLRFLTSASPIFKAELERYTNIVMQKKRQAKSGIDTGFITYCFGPGEGLEDIIEENTNDEISKTLSDHDVTSK